MGNIVLLDDLTINKIAAGEVIERPASVVKEMVENSIDAGAKNITVEIKNGGISFIKITDNGSGISEDDMEMAFERHATSKIRKAVDLETVTTMGFRGEALASIAAIANVEMVSKKEGEEIGHKIVVEGGKILEKAEIGCPVGTTITVRNLFFNTPVRYKFLKKDYTEGGYIEDNVRRIALVNKDISIKLISSGKNILQTNGSGDFKNIIYSIYGKDIANGIMEVEYVYEDIKVSGVVGKPEIARANRQNQIFFVNGRYVKDKNLTAAVDQAYKGMIPIGKFGFVILNLEMNPQKLDVNVHPAKLEVRFQDENTVFKAVYHAIKAGFGKSELVENIERPIEIEAKREEPKDEGPKLEIKEGMTIEERIQAINSLISQITPEKTMQTGAKLEIPQMTSENKLEDLYKTGSIADKVEEKKEREYDEAGRAIEFGNTRISSNTQEINVVEVKEVITQSEPVKVLENQDTIQMEKEPAEIAQEDTQQETKKDETIVLSVEKTDAEIKMAEEKKDEFITNVVDKLLEAKLKEEDSTEIIDTTKVKEALKEIPEITPEFEEMYKKAFGIEVNANRKNEAKKEDKSEKLDVAQVEYAEALNESLFENSEEYHNIPYQFIGIAFSTYIMIEMKEELYMIDQHAAHERILYEKVKANYYREEEKDSQLLLLPDIVQLTNKEMDIAEENIEMFAKAGFVFEEFGDNTIKVTQVPSMCENLNTKQLFLELLDEIDTVAVTATQEKEDKFIATVACKAAVKAHMKLDLQEVDSLMQELLQLPNPFTCPHGRPTAIKMTKYDLERKFARK